MRLFNLVPRQANSSFKQTFFSILAASFVLDVLYNFATNNNPASDDRLTEQTHIFLSCTIFTATLMAFLTNRQNAVPQMSEQNLHFSSSSSNERLDSPDQDVPSDRNEQTPDKSDNDVRNERSSVESFSSK